MDNLKDKTVTGLFWNLVERVGLRVIQFTPIVILARLLSPEEFGLIGMLAIFIALARTFLDSGFGLALIQKSEITYVDECSMFFFNISVGIIAVILFFVAAPWIAAFYAQPSLTPLTRWLSLDVLIESFALVQIARLTRALDFKTLVKANLLATIFSSVFGIAAAYLGMGVWSLVIQTISDTILQTANLWWLSSWRPAWIFSRTSLKSMFRFGSHMLGSSLIATFFDNLYHVFIGKYFSASSLGYYTRSSSLKNIVVDTTSATLARVLFPALSNIQDDMERLKRAYRKSVILITFIHFPLMLGLIVVATPLINLLFSAKWSESILYFQLMCTAGILYPLQVVNLEILKVKGRSDLFFQLTLIKRMLMIVAILITFRWGIPAMLIGQIVNAVIGYGLNSYYSDRLIGYSISSQIADWFPNLFYAFLAAAGAWWIGTMLDQSDWLMLSVEITVGAGVFIALNAATRSEPLLEIVALSRQYLVPRLFKG